MKKEHANRFEQIKQHEAAAKAKIDAIRAERKKKKALSSGKEKEKPIREVVRKEGQERACPVICVVFQPELDDH